MWQLVKAEIRYNSDFIYPLAWGLVIFALGQYYLSMYSERQAYVIGTLLLNGSLFLTIFLGVRRTREKRDRLLMLLPVSARQVSLARLFTFGFYIAGMVVLATVLNYGVRMMAPRDYVGGVTIVSLASIALIYIAVYYFLAADIKGYTDKNRQFLNMSVPAMTDVMKMVLVFLGILCFLLLSAAIVNIQNGRFPNDLDKVFGTLIHDMILTWPWAVGFLAAALVLSLLGIRTFEKRRSYVQ